VEKLAHFWIVESSQVFRYVGSDASSEVLIDNGEIPDSGTV
jgi:hypothetical protein